MFDFKAIQEECIKCGKCIPVCTIHQINPDETTSPRGFIDLLGTYHDGKLELDETTKEIFESCFLCTNCVFVCPNKLPTDLIIEQVRFDIAKKFGISWYKLAYFELLKRRKLMDTIFFVGSLFTPLLFKSLPKKASITSRIKLPILKNRTLPMLQKRSFLNSHDEFQNRESKRKVAIFIGCFANYHYKSVGESLLGILKELDIGAFLAKKQLCCGAPAYFTGDFPTVEFLVKKNIEYFESFIDEIEAIIIPEATCSAMIKADWVHFLESQKEYEWVDRAKKLLPKIYMATEFLEKKTNLKELLAKKGKKLDEVITYHDPCHARKVQGIFKEPRALLAQNYKLVEMEDPNRCCGFGGVTFQTQKYEYTLKAGEPKAKMIKSSGANIVAAECSACRMQLVNVLNHFNVDINFAHPLELIYKALC